MKYKNITVAGGGVLGSQIAFQTAYCGFNVTIYLIDEQSVIEAKDKVKDLKNKYLDSLDDMDKGKEWCPGIADFGKKLNKKECTEKIENACKSIRFITGLKEAVEGADLVIESISEKLDIKREFYSTLAPLLDKKTVVVTNSSSLLPSSLAKYTGRPEKFLSLHFANTIWKKNTAEVMVHDTTDEKYFKEVIEFANAIRMFVLPLTKEKAGYLLNSMLIPFLLSGLDMYVNGISTPEAIDDAWTRGTGAPYGPFAIFDIVGIATALNIVDQYQKVPGLLSPLLRKMLLPYNFKGMKEVLNKMMDEGRTGKAAGEGFYKYDKNGKRK